MSYENTLIISFKCSCCTEIVEKNFKNLKVFNFETLKDFANSQIFNDIKDNHINLFFLVDYSFYLRYKLLFYDMVLSNFSKNIILFISENFINIDDSDILETCCMYDFIKKPLNDKLLVNRLKLLFKLSNKLSLAEESVGNILDSLWGIIKFSDFYFLILSNEGKVTSCNIALSKALGFKNFRELLGRKWIDFLPKENLDLLNHVSERIKEGDPNYREFINDIVTLDNNKILVRWFNTKINHGYNGIMSLGVPILNNYHKGIENQNIDEMRNFWKNIIEYDRKNIGALRELIMKESDNITHDSICKIAI